MKKTIFSILLTCLTLATYGQTVSKSEVYKSAADWYSFDYDGVDSVGSNALKLHNVKFTNDAQRGRVAIINHVDTGYMEFSKPAISGEQFTVASWFYFQSSYSDWWQTIFEFYNDQNNNNFYLCPKFESLGVVSENKTTSSWQSVSCGNYRTPTDQWVHLAMTFDNGTVCVYANGALVGSGTISNTMSALGLNRYFIGVNPKRMYKALDAKYDDLAVFNKVLNSSQVYALAHDTLSKAPDYEPYVFESEDYLPANWGKGTDGDISYGYYNGTETSAASASNSLLYGVVKGEGQLSLWAKVKTDKAISLPFWVKVNNEQWKVCNAIDATTDWKWVLLQRFIPTTSQGYAFRISPAVANLKVDKFLITYNWDYDPNVSYSKSDASAPTTPSGLSVANTTEYTSQLKWNKSTDDKGIVAYDVMNGSELFMVTSDTIISPSLVASTSYNFSIRAKDAAGNVSSTSSAISVTTSDLVFSSDFSDKKQTIHHFGASDAWSVETIGLWPDAKRDSLAKLLFSSKFDAQGNPEGVALSNWRFRIGDGSRDQASSGFSAGNWHKSTHCFLNADGTYDWTKQAGSVWFLKQAKAYGVPHFTGWTDSPPYFYTKSGYVFRVTNETSGYNLKTDSYNLYSEFLANVANHFESEGIHFDVVSPVNEPQWSWDYKVGEGGQPGSYCSNSELITLVKSINDVFDANKVKSKILISEAGALDYLYSDKSKETDNQIYEFWNKSSSNYMGNLPYLSKYVAGHGYYTETTVANTLTSRQSIAVRLKNTDSELEYWQTEYSLLSDGYSKEKAVMEPIDYSLFLARVIYYDLAVGNCTGWDWWSTFSRPWGEDHKYRFALINWYPNVDSVTCSDGTFSLTKNLWVIGNYSHFVRPGYSRVGSSRSDNLTAAQSADKQLVSTYLSPNADTAVFVVINYADADQLVKLECSNLPSNGVVEKLKPYVTSVSDDLKAYPEVSANVPVTVKARSVTTFVGIIKKDETNIDNISNNNSSSSVYVYPNPATEKVMVEVKNGSIEKIELYNASGKLTKDYKLTGNSVILNVNNIKAGLYYLSVYYDGKKESKKLLITK
jgi:O-glycosyl hydrolase